MTRRRRRVRDRARCQHCQHPIAWFRTTHGSWRSCEPRPVDGRTHNNCPPAMPVENNRWLWPFEDLVADLQGRRECSRADAEAEAYDMPWYIPHTCPHGSSTADELEETAG